MRTHPLLFHSTSHIKSTLLPYWYGQAAELFMCVENRSVYYLASVMFKVRSFWKIRFNKTTFVLLLHFKTSFKVSCELNHCCGLPCWIAWGGLGRRSRKSFTDLNHCAALSWATIFKLWYPHSYLLQFLIETRCVWKRKVFSSLLYT